MLGLAGKLGQTLAGHLSLAGDQSGEILNSGMIISFSTQLCPLNKTLILVKV